MFIYFSIYYVICFIFPQYISWGFRTLYLHYSRGGTNTAFLRLIIFLFVAMVTGSKGVYWQILDTIWNPRLIDRRFQDYFASIICWVVRSVCNCQARGFCIPVSVIFFLLSRVSNLEGLNNKEVVTGISRKFSEIYKRSIILFQFSEKVQFLTIKLGQRLNIGR